MEGMHETMKRTLVDMHINLIISLVKKYLRYLLKIGTSFQASFIWVTQSAPWPPGPLLLPGYAPDIIFKF
jgi:hypothetical protein